MTFSETLATQEQKYEANLSLIFQRHTVLPYRHVYWRLQMPILEQIHTQISWPFRDRFTDMSGNYGDLG
jgi:hypothetical protein